jgi:hypothetical protein
MSIMKVNLTIKKQKTNVFYLKIIVKNALNFVKNELLLNKWCKNYTIGNFTNR